MTRPFTVDIGWAAVLAALNLRAADVLRRAQLPEDLFSQARPTLESEGFSALFNALAEALDTDAPGLLLGQAITAESFSPPLFAAFCSPDLTVATERLARFKPLVGPLILEPHAMTGGLELTFGAEPGVTLPEEYVAAELVFLVHMARLALKTEVRPIAVEMISPSDSPAYSNFFGRAVRPGPFNRVVFSAKDARAPFLSANPALFAAFQTDLQARLDELNRGATVTDRLRAVLMEALPAGQPEVATVSKRLGMSSRTLQRKLGAEQTSFQGELRSLRERLARDYLARTTYSASEIAYLLGYEDPNSFFRAFNDWTGTTPERARVA